MKDRTPGLPRLMVAALVGAVAYLTAALADRLAGPPAPAPVELRASIWRAGIATDDTREDT
ncbi:hypothetical protein [Pseudonocardia sp. NPDC049635]|uniref:hypothetical protein n=1 Tax=Pseudonocardia sp. NPDC049635 TaxID=3155506 RepID=UPI003407DB8D